MEKTGEQLENIINRKSHLEIQLVQKLHKLDNGKTNMVRPGVYALY